MKGKAAKPQPKQSEQQQSLLTQDLWFTIVKYLLAYQSLCFQDDFIEGKMKEKIIAEIKQYCGAPGVKKCKQILDINASLMRSEKYQRTIQCARLREVKLLPEALIAELEQAQWNATETNMFERFSTVLAMLNFIPNKSINSLHVSQVGRYNLGSVICELKSPTLLSMVLSAGYHDKLNDEGKCCLTNKSAEGNYELVQVLLAEGRHQNYDHAVLFDLLSDAIEGHHVKLVEIYLALPVDYVHGLNILVLPFSSILKQLKDHHDNNSQPIIRIEKRELNQKKQILSMLLRYRNQQGCGFPLTVQDQIFNIIIICVRAQQPELLELILNNAPESEVAKVINEQCEAFGNSTALALAAMLDSYHMVRLLLEKGADTNLPADKPSAQPLALARAFNIRILLQQHGAHSNTYSQWFDFDLQGKIHVLRPICAEALYGNVESLKRVLQADDCGDVNLTEKDVGTPLFYAVARMLGIGFEAVYHQQGDHRSPDEIVVDCIAKFNLLVSSGANVNDPAVKGTSMTLLDFAILLDSARYMNKISCSDEKAPSFNALGFIKLLAPHKPQTSPDIQESLSTICGEAARSSITMPLVRVLVEHGLISSGIFYVTLGFAFSTQNVSCIKLFLDNILLYGFEENHHNFLWSTLRMAFDNDKEKGKPIFYKLLALIVWATEIGPPREIAILNEGTEALDKIYKATITAKYQQFRKEKQDLIERLNTFNGKLQINSHWRVSANVFSCHASVRQATLIMRCIANAHYDEDQCIISVKIDNPNYEPRLPEKMSFAPVEKLGVSSRKFLQDKGYSNAEIVELRQPEVVVEDNDIIEKPDRKITWCDGKISSDDGCIIALENSTHYLFIDKKRMLNSGCSEMDLSKLMQVRRLGDNSHRCIAPLAGKLQNLQTAVQLCGQLFTVPLKGEIRDASIEARLICGPAIESDQGGAKLLVAVAHIRSMHNDANIDQLLLSLQPKKGNIIELDYEQAKADAEQKSTATLN